MVDVNEGPELILFSLLIVGVVVTIWAFIDAVLSMGKEAPPTRPKCQRDVSATPTSTPQRRSTGSHIEVS